MSTAVVNTSMSVAGNVHIGQNLSVLSTAYLSVLSVTRSAFVGENLSVQSTAYLSVLSVATNAWVGAYLSVVSDIWCSGNIYAVGDIQAFYNYSDARLKTDVAPISSALDTVVTQLRPVEFTWRDDITNVDRRNTRDAGFIAQEIHQVIPYTEMHMGPDGEYLGVRHERIIPYLVRAIQELKSEVDDLRAQLQRS
jgi:hypothetical protein